MYYFELFELPVSLKTDKAALLRKYYALSRQYHPDRFTSQGEAEQEDALKMSEKINEAKVILDDAYKRLAYILKEKNIVLPDEKYQLSPMFLGQMMDINEQLMVMDNAETTAQLQESIRNEISDVEAALYTEVKTYFEADELQANESDLLKLKDYYYKRKYLSRILDRLS